MSRIDARSKTVRELLNGVKYTIDYYQREYKWGTPQIAELLADLEGKFLANYEEGHDRSQIQHYAHYFLGSIVISHKNGRKFIIDGQQRLTSLTLLLIKLHNLQQARDETDQVNVTNLIFSEKFGKKSFNIDVEERTACMESLYKGLHFDAHGKSESVNNMVARYDDFRELFPETLNDGALPYFIDWLLEKVELVEITAYSDDDAYSVFETMNDRGLSLSPSEMLKGYLLSNIKEDEEKITANDLWRKLILELTALDKKEEADFFKAWIRARYAETIRERKKGATDKDFEKIGTGFHKWVREERKSIGLERSRDFKDFIENQFSRYALNYLQVRKAAHSLTPGMEYVFYNAQNNFTLQYPLMLAPLRPEDDQDTVERKIRLVAGYLDIFIVRRAVNFRTLGYSAIVYTMFNLMKEIRDLDLFDLAALLKAKVAELTETFDGFSQFHLNQWSKRYIHHILARITHYIEEQCGIESSFETYITRGIKKPFEIEHIWADKYERYSDEFATHEEFAQSRDRIGDLILLPRGVNQSLGDATYEKKVEAYFGQNLLAKSLNEKCYRNNPSFLTFVDMSTLPFQPHSQFKKADLEARQELYRQICDNIWSPSRFDQEVEA
ncbi:DUF262 domain-containing HNH endonuclease family protein [Nitrospinae bacterium AH_259_B05_G02_I21]|nr:DUF262 domain-containing HNH endonuclease family protein [Nitrospinae bacterium AH_259_B05_G02_I21]